MKPAPRRGDGQRRLTGRADRRRCSAEARAISSENIHLQQHDEGLLTDLRKSLDELAAANQHLREVVRQLESMARTDELTGLYNRRWFNLMLEGNWAEATRHNSPLACIMIDLDGFKLVNDKFGHHQGDDLLRLAAKVIRANCREIDVPARYGGDEFCILMSNTAPHEAAMVADRIVKEFEHAMRSHPAGAKRLGMSIGLSHIDVSRPVNAEQLVNHADEAMYAAKAAGKRQVRVRAENGTQLPMWQA